MAQHLNRREFLKVAATLPLITLLEQVPALGSDALIQSRDRPNLIIILFDALSARNLSLYGYPRKTAPNLERFAGTGTVYHAHHSAANFTTPSTASLFTGAYPWTHRAFTLSGLISPQARPNNMFRLLKDTYKQIAFSQNLFADTLLYQFDEHISRHENLDNFSLVGHTFYNKLFPNDAIHGLKSYDQFLFKREEAHGSLLTSILNDVGVMLGNRVNSQRFEHIHPHGLPRLANTDVYFMAEQVMDGVMGMVSELPKPSFTYIHLMPPHEPYVPTSEFLGSFNDGWAPQAKKGHRLAPGVPQKRLDERRQTYDEFIANIDAEFGRLLDHLERIGLLEDSFVILTSDHGELFERGAHGHSTPLVFEPVIHIPLIISAPGQQQRKDIYSLTSNVDLLPTLLNIAGISIPDWCEGQVLPGLGGEETSERSIFTLEAKKNPAYSPLSKATIALLKGDYKLIHYVGYKHYKDQYELYDLNNDPEEVQNLYPSHPATLDLKAELDGKFQEINQPYI